MIDICYTCGKELDWNEVLVYWKGVKTPTGPIYGELKAFCDDYCALKIGACCPLKEEQLTLNI